MQVQGRRARGSAIRAVKKPSPREKAASRHMKTDAGQAASNGLRRVQTHCSVRRDHADRDAEDKADVSSGDERMESME